MQVSSISSPRDGEDDDYRRLVARMRGAVGSPLFTTDATGLYDVFLAALPADRRQHYECRTCRRFVDGFGGLVCIDGHGMVHSPFWDDWKIPPFFYDSVDAVSRTVAKARVNGVFLTSERVWGLPDNRSPKSPSGEWHHMHVVPSSEMIHRPSALLTSEQVMAEKLQDHAMLSRGLAEFPIEIVRQAHTLLTTGALYRSEKCIGVAKWLLDLHDLRAKTKHKVERENFVWRAVATAPTGFCHVRSTMIGTLLEDLAAGKPFEAIKRSFDAKMSPIQYQRPQAAPTDGQLAAAERVIEKLASAGSLARRYATLEDVLSHAIWTPRAQGMREPSGGVFGHLKSKGRAAELIDVSALAITWEKFQRTVLPIAETIEFRTPHGSAPFFAFVTAADLAAPPILQWDREDQRNPVSQYFYHGGSQPTAWGLPIGAFCEVAAITRQPSNWTQAHDHQGDGAYFILRGARDLHPRRAGIGLFPETLKSEYHGIRAAIEAYSHSQKLGGEEAASACGVAIQKNGSSGGLIFRVTAAGARVMYRLDRWD